MAERATGSTLREAGLSDSRQGAAQLLGTTWSGEERNAMPVRELLWHATSGDDHGQGKSRKALQRGWNYRRLPWKALPCYQSALRTSVWRGEWPRRAVYLALLSLSLVLTMMVGRLYAQAQAVSGSEPAPALAVPDPLEPLPSTQERLLAPVPQPFNWLEREAPSNPLLEALLSLQEPSNLLVTVSLTEEVSDNFTHSPSGRRVATRTGVTLGTAYRLDIGHSFVSLANTVRAFYETRSDRTQIGFANLSLNAGHQLPPWSFGLTESFQRDDVTAQSATQPLLRTDQNFIRNSISPQVRYDITPITSATLRYTNTVVIDEDSDAGNSTSHRVALSLRHQFSANLNSDATYTFTTSQGSGASGGHSHRLSASGGYKLDPDTSVDLSVFGALVERSGTGARNSQTYGATIGGRRVLFATVSLLASIGPTVFKRQGDDAKLRANWNVSLDGPIPIFATPSLTLTLTTRQGVQDTVGEVNDVGLVLRQVIAARLNYRPSAVLTGQLFAEYSRNELLEDVGTAGAARGRRDNLWSAGMTAAYTLTRIISLTGTYRYQRGESNTARNDFEENRVTVALTGRFPIF